VKVTHARALALTLGLLTGCRAAPSAWAPGDSVRAGSVTALALDGAGRPWWVTPAGLRPLRAGASAVPLVAGDSVRWLGAWGTHLYLRVPGALLAVETDSGRLHRRALTGPVALDSVRGVVLTATTGGAVLGLGPRTLVPL